MFIKSIVLIVYTSLCVNIIIAENSTNLIQDNFNWKCANNASCVKSVTNFILNNLQQRKPIEFGEIIVDPIDSKPFTGRSLSFWNFLNGNALKIPFGPVMLSLQRSVNYDNYIEVALLKKSSDAGLYINYFSYILQANI